MGIMGIFRIMGNAGFIPSTVVRVGFGAPVQYKYKEEPSGIMLVIINCLAPIFVEFQGFLSREFGGLVQGLGFSSCLVEPPSCTCRRSLLRTKRAQGSYTISSFIG